MNLNKYNGFLFRHISDAAGFDSGNVETVSVDGDNVIFNNSDGSTVTVDLSSYVNDENGGIENVSIDGNDLVIEFVDGSTIIENLNQLMDGVISGVVGEDRDDNPIILTKADGTTIVINDTKQFQNYDRLHGTIDHVVRSRFVDGVTGDQTNIFDFDASNADPNNPLSFSKQSKLGTNTGHGFVESKGVAFFENTLNTANQFIQIDLGLDTSRNQMFRFDLKGHAYGISMPIDITFVGYYYIGNAVGSRMMSTNVISNLDDYGFAANFYEDSAGKPTIEFTYNGSFSHLNFRVDHMSTGNGTPVDVATVTISDTSQVPV